MPRRWPDFRAARAGRALYRLLAGGLLLAVIVACAGRPPAISGGDPPAGGAAPATVAAVPDGSEAAGSGPTGSGPTGSGPTGSGPTGSGPTGSGPTISGLVTNLGPYPDGHIPAYSRLELTFQVETVAGNRQWPFDAQPPPGVPAGTGVTIDAHFTPDNWQTVYLQPAFYYQEFESAATGAGPWLYPTDRFTWMVRFTPNEPGRWQVKLTAEDAGGRSETAPLSFEVAPAAAPGFLRVSAADPRYFEFEDGTYFPALGYNLQGPVDAATLNDMGRYGIQLARAWIPARWSIFGSAWSPWRPFGALPPGSEPNARLRSDATPPFSRVGGQDPPLAVPGSELFLWLSQDDREVNGRQPRLIPCTVLGWDTLPVAVRPQTAYRLRVRYRALDLAGPRIAGAPMGFAVKLGGWLWDDQDESRRCHMPGTGAVLAASYDAPAGAWHQMPDTDNPGWSLLEGRWSSGDQEFLDLLYLAIENATAGSVLVDQVWLEEVRPDGRFGPNILPKSWMAMHQYFDQRGSFALDQALEQAAAAGVYFKLVVLEKNDLALNLFLPDGTLSPWLPGEQPEPLFYGAGRERDGGTKIRWLQQAWWRYLQARWGYATAIHSWELLNEGPPDDTRHYILADEFGRYMHTVLIPPGQARPHPHRHLITTSFWSGFPRAFWEGTHAPHIDYADIHFYARGPDVRPLGDVYEPEDYADAALFSQKLSLAYGALQPGGVGKPLMRGETGWFFDGPDPFFQGATGGVWLHNLVWAGLNPGGLIESPWWSDRHIVHPRGAFDLRPVYRSYANFVRDIPLNNGRYRDAAAVVSSPALRAWGQLDAAAGRAHLWIQNRSHTWKNVLDGAPIPAVSGQVTLPGLRPGATYRVAWWDTRQPDADRQLLSLETVTAAADGRLTLAVSNLAADVAVKIDRQP